MAIFGNMRDAEFFALSCGSVCNIRILKTDRAAIGFYQSGNCFNKFGLSVALDSGDSDNFARANFKRHIINRNTVFARDVQIFYFQNRPARFGIRFFNTQKNIAPDNHSRQIFLTRFARFHIANRFPVAHHGYIVGNRQNFVEFVRDNDNRFTLRFHTAQNPEKIFDFLRR